MRYTSHRLLILLMLTCCPFLIVAQSLLQGAWQGVITQQPAGLDSIYNYSLEIREEAGRLVGSSTIRMREDPEYFGQISFEGKWVGNELVLTEIEVVAEQLWGFAYWCLKTLHLELLEIDGRYVLQGHWESDMCSWSDGKIYLERSMS